VASRVVLERDALALPSFDHQLPANVLVVRFPGANLRVVAIRVPWYGRAQRDLALRAWDWLESAAADLIQEAAIIIGDLNVSTSSRRRDAADPLRRITRAGWALATSEIDPSYFSPRGSTNTLDHLLHTVKVKVVNASFATEAGGHVLAGSPAALSDHAALVAEIEV
jgi:endonuclease/exonuclease/phosphatase family metal-dependent hydrolase